MYMIKRVFVLQYWIHLIETFSTSVFRELGKYEYDLFRMCAGTVLLLSRRRRPGPVPASAYIIVSSTWDVSYKKKKKKCLPREYFVYNNFFFFTYFKRYSS